MQRDTHEKARLAGFLSSARDLSVDVTGIPLRRRGGKHQVAGRSLVLARNTHVRGAMAQSRPSAR